MQQLYPVKGKVQHYSWGGFDYIPQMLGVSNTVLQPYAEYWLGAHPNHPSIVVSGNGEHTLYDLINQHKEALLGPATRNKFGSLPFLLKVLDVRQMLSIQVHPDKASAKVGYQKENEAGIALTAYNRNYKDENHKPELMVALSDFWLLHGFKPEEQLNSMLASVPELAFLLPVFEQGGYEELYRVVMSMEQAKVNEVIRPVAERVMPLYERNELTRDAEDFWAARAIQTFCKGDHYDRGIFSIYLFNLVHLKRGEGIYQPEGIPHAYLEGQNVEIMANSDNVLRAGLTDKYIDVPELLKYVRFEATHPDVIKPSPEGEVWFAPPVEEFVLTQYQSAGGEEKTFATTGPEIILVTEGTIVVSSNGEQLTLNKGEAAFVPAGVAVQVAAVNGAEYFRAGVPCA